MNIESFVSGKYIKSDQYKFFMPEKINHSFIITDSKIHTLLELASLKLGELNSFAKLVPDIDMFIRSHVMKEAVTSSKIEGTRTNMENAFIDKLDLNPEHRDDWNEVNQYVRATNQAIQDLKKLPLSNRLLKNTHKILLSQVRGKHKSPGEFRRSQNWIGGTSLDNAFFIPPHPDYVDELMSDLEKFLHTEKIQVPHLVKIAIAHYQFETIHPFLDGNGRIGRLLITLYLVSNGILDKPLLYLSDYFESHKVQYFEKLTRARERNDLQGWLIFFLGAVEKTSTKGIQIMGDVLRLKEEIQRDKIIKLGRRIKNGHLLIDHLFMNPVLSSRAVEKILNLSAKASNDLIKSFVTLGILEEITGFKRNRLFLFKDYLTVLKR